MQEKKKKKEKKEKHKLLQKMNLYQFKNAVYLLSVYQFTN